MTQDYSIFSYTAGNMCSNGRDIAKFYWDLLGPERYIVSDATLEKMMEYEFFDMGFGVGKFPYGAGLMVLNNNATKMRERFVADGTDLLDSIGHEGSTYGYTSENAYFPNMEFALSSIINNDFDMVGHWAIRCNLL